MWWIAGGVALLALVVLIVVVMAVAGHLRPLERAMRRLRLRAEQAEGLQTKLLTLQERMSELQDRSTLISSAESVEQAAARAERVKPGRTEAAR